jgi:hypothetical protein
MGLGQLDDDDYPAITMGQAAELLELQPAFLRSLDAAGVAATALARLFAQLDLVSATGVITVSLAQTRATTATGGQLVEASGPARSRFTPFPHPDPGRHTGAEYL